MEDRVLGESRRERVPCSSIMAFTGNKVLPKGDLASRTLMTLINVDRPDPENRHFRHPDPFGWTIDHRREIITALYTILVGNPRLRVRGERGQTRFKQWWRLVGAAIEHAAHEAKQSVDFAIMFQQTEEQDEDTASLADILQRLDKLAEHAAFKSADVLTWTNLDTEDSVQRLPREYGPRHADDKRNRTETQRRH
jgi:hypothetical protein